MPWKKQVLEREGWKRHQLAALFWNSFRVVFFCLLYFNLAWLVLLYRVDVLLVLHHRQDVLRDPVPLRGSVCSFSLTVGSSDIWLWHGSWKTTLIFSWWQSQGLMENILRCSEWLKTGGLATEPNALVASYTYKTDTFLIKSCTFRKKDMCVFISCVRLLELLVKYLIKQGLKFL